MVALFFFSRIVESFAGELGIVMFLWTSPSHLRCLDLPPELHQPPFLNKTNPGHP